MEVDQKEDEAAAAVSLQVNGKVTLVMKGAAFFQFSKDGVEQVCLFRPNKLVVDGQKLGASHFKTLEAILNVLAIGDEVTAVVVPSTNNKVFTTSSGQQGGGGGGQQTQITPNWYADKIWKGIKPIESSQHQDTTKPLEAEIDEVKGRILVSKGSKTKQYDGVQQGPPFFITFVNCDEQDYAIIKGGKFIYIDGKRTDLNTVPDCGGLEVTFSATSHHGFKEFVHVEEGGGGMKEEAVVRPRWKAGLVWTGCRPTEAEMAERPAGGDRRKKRNTEFLENIKDCEYLCARLEKLVDKHTGILVNKNRNIVFNIKVLSIDGQTFTENDNLFLHLEAGETLFAYIKPTKERELGGHTVAHEAAQVWRGKRTAAGDASSKAAGASEHKKKKPIPLPKEATHLDIEGTVTEIETAGLGYMAIHADAAAGGDASLAGQKVLFSRNRLYVDGHKLKFKDCLLEHTSIGDRLMFDMVRADPLESEGQYQWLAVMTWKGCKPNIDEVNSEISKKTENYRNVS